MVQAVIMGNQLRLMLQKPTPQTNLLDNWYFADPVSQRGQKEYTNTGYTIDRWRLDDSINMTVKDDHILFTGEQNRDYCNFVQIAKSKESVEGKQVTFSLLGEGYFNLILRINGTYLNNPIEFNNISKTLITYTFSISENLTDDVFVIIQSLHIVDKAAKVYATKLELGNRFTGWPVWDYGAELLKCQRYFRSLAIHDLWGSDQNTTNYIDFAIPGARGMRTKPAIVNPNGFNLSKQGFTFEFVSYGLSPRLRATKTSHGIVGPYLEALENIYLDANL